MPRIKAQESWWIKICIEKRPEKLFRFNKGQLQKTKMNCKLHRKVFKIIEIIQTTINLGYLKEDFSCCVGDYVYLRQIR